MKNMVKVLSNILLIGIVVYGVMCYGEIITKNDKPNPHYSNYNLMVKIFSN